MACGRLVDRQQVSLTSYATPPWVEQEGNYESEGSEAGPEETEEWMAGAVGRAFEGEEQAE